MRKQPGAIAEESVQGVKWGRGREFEFRSVSRARDDTSFQRSYDFYFYLYFYSKKPDLRTFRSAGIFKGVCGRDGARQRSILSA